MNKSFVIPMRMCIIKFNNIVIITDRVMDRKLYQYLTSSKGFTSLNLISIGSCAVISL